MIWLYSLPRATRWARFWALFFVLVVLSMVWQQWPHLHDDLAIAQWIAWFFVLIAILYLPRLLVIVIFGRVPRVYQHLGRRLFKTIPEIHKDIAKDIEERNERSRRL